MAQKQIMCWRVTVVRPGAGGAQVVLPIARDKLQASKRAAYMLGLSWKESARYMVVRGPIKAQARQIREWNETYPQWSTEREDGGTPHPSPGLRETPGATFPSRGRLGDGGRIAASASPPRNDKGRGNPSATDRAGEPGRYGGENPSTAARSPRAKGASSTGIAGATGNENSVSTGDLCPAGRGGLKGGQVARATGRGDPAATKEG